MKHIFTKQIKNEIMKKTAENGCCNLSFLYGMILSSCTLSLKEKQLCFSLTTDDQDVCLFLNELLKKNYNGSCDFEIMDELAFGNLRYEITIDHELTEKIITDLGIRIGRTLSFEFNDDIVSCEECMAKVVAGAFLISGTTNIKVSEEGELLKQRNGKGYHVEITSSNHSLLEVISHFLAENDADVRISQRSTTNILYLSDFESVEIFLALIKATKSLLSLESEAISREIRKKVNREVNSTERNIKKQIDAANMQIEEILFIEKKIGLDSLPKELQEVCKARCENPDKTLIELADFIGNNITKSGVNHRLRKIRSIYLKLKENETNQQN